MVENHLELTQNAVNNLYIMIEKSAAFKKEESKSAFLKLSQMEMEADELRRNMVEELSKGEMFPEERSDLMELVRAVDWIADWSREAGRILEIIPFENTSNDLKDAVLAMCKATVSCVKVLINCIQILNKNPQKALDLANEVEMLEETIDDLYSDTRSIIAFGAFSGFSMGQMILLNEFIDAIETVADWCENTADIVRAVAIRAQ